MRKVLVVLMLLGSSVAAAQAVTPPPLVDVPQMPSGEPPPPVYSPQPYAPLPPTGQPPQRLQPYAPYAPQQPIPLQGPAKKPVSEWVLGGAEFATSAAITAVSSYLVYAAVSGATSAQAQATASLAALLYLGLIPVVSSLPVWLVSLFSDQYEGHIGPAIEAGSAISSIALLVLLLAGDSNKGLAVGGVLLFVVMPRSEVIALNVTKTPKLGGFAEGPLWDAPPSAQERWASAAQPGQMLLLSPAIRF
jgi:hypothetical protein